MEQTKGYYRLEGKIWGLNNKEARDNGFVRDLTFRLQTNKTNSVFITVGQWKNTKMNVKIKSEGSDNVEEVNEQDAIDEIKKLFKDGDSVYVNCRSMADKYHNKPNFLLNQIYIKKDSIDFDSEDFEEVNELKQTIVITERPSKGTNVVLGMIANYQGRDAIEIPFDLEEGDVADYFVENVKVGDLMNVTAKILNVPVFNDGKSSQSDSKERKTLKGKVIGGNSNGGKKPDSYVNKIEIFDVDTEATKKAKYTREEIREALEGNTSDKPKTQKEDTDDLPF